MKLNLYTTLTLVYCQVFGFLENVKCNNLNKEDSSYWLEENRNVFLQKINNLKYAFGTIGNLKKAKNVILFIGDGMGLSTITASRLYKGNVDQVDPESGFLSFERFPFVSLAKVYSLDETVADSAATATSYLCGVKTNHYNLGVNGNVKPNDCEASKVTSNRVASIIRWAQEDGKSTGVVTTTRITHATPAASYAHSANRDWEHSTNGNDCEDIAKQLIFGKTGENINVILGGGRQEFLPKYLGQKESGLREDGLNLIDSWIEKKRQAKQSARYVTTKEQLASVDERNTNYVLGLFANDHLQYNLDKPKNSTEPRLCEMVEKAIKLLKKNKKGFVLFVEGGRIDHAHHENHAKKALDEAYHLDKAIQKALTMVNIQETLIVVTADHSHSLTINGYQERGSNILGTTFENFTTLLYTNGPGNNRTDSRLLSTTDNEYRQKSVEYLEESNHAGEDIPVYAIGPGSQLLSGVYDQTYIACVIGASTCTGPFSNLATLQNLNTCF